MKTTINMDFIMKAEGTNRILGMGLMLSFSIYQKQSIAFRLRKTP